ncbi:MAG: DsbA family protein [Patescibacteria group bacterium]|nr:DsbA family protein [Patescibacteria group bacterium]
MTPLSIIIAGLIIATAIIFTSDKVILPDFLLFKNTANRQAATGPVSQTPKFDQCMAQKKYVPQLQSESSAAAALGVNATPTIFVDGIVFSNWYDYASLKSFIELELKKANGEKVTLPKDLAVVPVKKVDLGGNLPLGNPSASVKVVEFGDYQCPYCEQFYSSVFPQLKKDFIDTGKVEFAFRDLAFLGLESTNAALAASCANEQGKFWEYHDKLYGNQKGENQGAFSLENLKRFAAELSLK